MHSSACASPGREPLNGEIDGYPAPTANGSCIINPVHRCFQWNQPPLGPAPGRGGWIGCPTEPPVEIIARWGAPGLQNLRFPWNSYRPLPSHGVLGGVQPAARGFQARCKNPPGRISTPPRWDRLPACHGRARQGEPFPSRAISPPSTRIPLSGGSVKPLQRLNPSTLQPFAPVSPYSGAELNCAKHAIYCYLYLYKSI